MSSKSTNVDISQIAGNAPDDLKRRMADMSVPSGGDALEFGNAIFTRLKLAEVSIHPKADGPKKMEARVVYETVVERDMLNAGGSLHGACSALLVDNCSTTALMALQYASTKTFAPGVSQALNMVYHSPAALGVKIRIVNTSMAIGGRTMSSQTEIWNATDQRLVASGVHIKMHPSPVKAEL